MPRILVELPTDPFRELGDRAKRNGISPAILASLLLIEALGEPSDPKPVVTEPAAA